MGCVLCVEHFFLDGHIIHSTQIKKDLNIEWFTWWWKSITNFNTSIHILNEIYSDNRNWICTVQSEWDINEELMKSNLPMWQRQRVQKQRIIYLIMAEEVRTLRRQRCTHFHLTFEPIEANSFWIGCNSTWKCRQHDSFNEYNANKYGEWR